MNDWSALDRALSALIASGGVEVHEDGEWLAEFAQFRWEFSPQGSASLLHLWSDVRNLTRKIVAVKEQSGERLILEVQRFGKHRPGRLEFLRADNRRPLSRISREQFRSRFERLLAECFPDATVGPLTAAPDLKRSFSARYARGVMNEPAGDWALLATPPEENSVTAEDSLAFGLIWLDAVRARGAPRPVRGLRLFVPLGAGRILRERVLGLSAAARVEIFELNERDRRAQKLDVADAGNLESWLTPRSQMESLLAAARESASLVPALIDAPPGIQQAIQQRVLPGGHQAAFAFRGLDFARWSAEGLSFGLNDRKCPLNPATEAGLSRLLNQLNLNRNSLATETQNSLYRKAPERWLETLIREDPAKIDARLDAKFLYSQLPALSSGDRGVLDLLGVTRKGRLVVIELKASEDLQLPLQALDYWLRVRRHQQEGTFRQFGYFPGVELDPNPPLLMLVAPGLRFHSTSGALLEYLSPEIGVTRIGLNENWRRGIRVVFRQ